MSEEERRRGHQEREKQEHDDDVERTVSFFKVLWASGWEPFLVDDRIALITVPVHESVREKVLASENVTMSEAFQRVHGLDQTESRRVVLRDARERFEAWLHREEGDDDE
jgi:hypothetical protein